MAVTASELRRNIYRLLDQVIETGVPLEIKRGDHILRVSTVVGPTKLESLPLRALFSCEPDLLVHQPTALLPEATAVLPEPNKS